MATAQQHFLMANDELKKLNQLVADYENTEKCPTTLQAFALGVSAGYASRESWWAQEYEEQIGDSRIGEQIERTRVKLGMLIDRCARKRG